MLRKTAIMMGGSSGIGEAVAKALSQQSYKIIITGRLMDRLEKLAANNDNIIPIEMDITDYQETARSLKNLSKYLVMSILFYCLRVPALQIKT